MNQQPSGWQELMQTTWYWWQEEQQQHEECKQSGEQKETEVWNETKTQLEKDWRNETEDNKRGEE